MEETNKADFKSFPHEPVTGGNPGFESVPPVVSSLEGAGDGDEAA